MTDKELYDVCAKFGIQYTNEEAFKLTYIFVIDQLPVFIKSKLILTGVVSLALVPQDQLDWLMGSGLFEKDAATLSLKKYSLCALASALGIDSKELAYFANLHCIHLGIKIKEAQFLYQDFIEDVRSSILRRIGSSLRFGQYGTLESPKMNTAQRRFTTLWLVFGVREYGGFTIAKFLACFGEGIFCDSRVKRLPSLTNEKINEILFETIDSDSDARAIEWVEANVE